MRWLLLCAESPPDHTQKMPDGDEDVSTGRSIVKPMGAPRTLATVALPAVDLLLRHDLPALPVAHRKTVVAFTLRRLDALPQPLFWGVAAVAGALRILMIATGPTAIIWTSTKQIPVVSEFFRLVRSLSYSYIWENWPDTAPDGSLRTAPQAS